MTDGEDVALVRRAVPVVEEAAVEREPPINYLCIGRQKMKLLSGFTIKRSWKLVSLVEFESPTESSSLLLAFRSCKYVACSLSLVLQISHGERNSLVHMLLIAARDLDGWLRSTHTITRGSLWFSASKRE